jgi:DNA-binding MarR family transcriptional regulator
MNERSQVPVLDADDTVSVQRHAWWAILLMHRRLGLQLMDEELRSETGVDLATYDALMHIVKAGKPGIRMTHLAQDVYMSKSGLTAMVDRLEERGWLQRIPDPDDRRAIRITLTEAGLEKAREAGDVHLASIERHFSEHVSDAEASLIREVMERVTPPPSL